MSKLATFTPDVAKAMFDYTRQNPRNAKAELAESVWGFGFTKDSPRQIFSLSKMFTAVRGVYYGFTMKPTEEPLRFIVSFFEQRGEEGTRNLGDEVKHIALIDDVPKVISNAANQAKTLADALRMEAGLPL